MSLNTEPSPITHSKKTAYHMEFGFRPEAAVWRGRRPIRPNFYPLATDLRNWLLRNGRLTFSTTAAPKIYTNPYTHDGSILSVNYAQIINDSAAFVDSRIQWILLKQRSDASGSTLKTFYIRLAFVRPLSNRCCFVLDSKKDTTEVRHWERYCRRIVVTAAMQKALVIAFR